MDEQQKLANSKEVLAFLAAEFPKCFSLQTEAKPLKIGNTDSVIKSETLFMFLLVYLIA